jgi:hypothetical protein
LVKRPHFPFSGVSARDTGLVANHHDCVASIFRNPNSTRCTLDPIYIRRPYRVTDVVIEHAVPIEE